MSVFYSPTHLTGLSVMAQQEKAQRRRLAHTTCLTLSTAGQAKIVDERSNFGHNHKHNHVNGTLNIPLHHGQMHGHIAHNTGIQGKYDLMVGHSEHLHQPLRKAGSNTGNEPRPDAGKDARVHDLIFCPISHPPIHDPDFRLARVVERTIEHLRNLARTLAFHGTEAPLRTIQLRPAQATLEELQTVLSTQQPHPHVLRDVASVYAELLAFMMSGDLIGISRVLADAGSPLYRVNHSVHIQWMSVTLHALAGQPHLLRPVLTTMLAHTHSMTVDGTILGEHMHHLLEPLPPAELFKVAQDVYAGARVPILPHVMHVFMRAIVALGGESESELLTTLKANTHLQTRQCGLDVALMDCVAASASNWSTTRLCAFVQALLGNKRTDTSPLLYLSQATSGHRAVGFKAIIMAAVAVAQAEWSDPARTHQAVGQLISTVLDSGQPIVLGSDDVHLLCALAVYENDSRVDGDEWTVIFRRLFAHCQLRNLAGREVGMILATLRCLGLETEADRLDLETEADLLGLETKTDRLGLETEAHEHDVTGDTPITLEHLSVSINCHFDLQADGHAILTTPTSISPDVCASNARNYLDHHRWTQGIHAIAKSKVTASQELMHKPRNKHIGGVRRRRRRRRRRGVGSQHCKMSSSLSLSLWDFDQGNDDDFTAAEYGQAEDTEEVLARPNVEQHDGGRDCLIFLVDASQEMQQAFETIAASLDSDASSEAAPLMAIPEIEGVDSSNNTYCETCLRVIHAALRSKILISEADLVSVVLYGTVVQLYGNTFDLSDALWTCQNLFSRLKTRVATKRIMIFTNNDNPHAADDDLRDKAKVKAGDLRDNGVEIMLMDLSQNRDGFNKRLFWDEITSVERVAGDDDDGISRFLSFHDLLDRTTSRVQKKRARMTIPLQLAEGMAIGVKVYNLVSQATKGKYSYVYNDTQPVVTKTAYYCENTTNPLLPTDMKYGAKFGNEMAVFSKEEVTQIKSFGQPGLRLLGFKDQAALKPWHHVKKSCFLYPDDKAGGSRCLRLRKLAICLFVSRAGVPPNMVALLPQAEKVAEDSHEQVSPPGFHVIFLPYAEDLREVNVDFDLPHADADQIKAATGLVRSLTHKHFQWHGVRNPSLQVHFNALEALALSRSKVEESVNDLVPSIPEPAAQAAEQFTQAVFPYGAPSGSAKRSTASGGTGASKRTKADESEMTLDILKQKYEKDQLARLTVAELKVGCKLVGLKAAGRKADLISALQDYFGQ
ncbi:uncharacterized protein MONBRDRAFT_32261 [Monosiga brevicollis MX1]|uniref:SAP domain-containing protein n=1 Tax=Monosiga brevicollis TaxID=81824 RepID=A9UYE6_MONBE|nr:uncharacterized protein MONBRDRAFT_32261 [Monosiga brevicollis MX1]EDQ89450.1 predicted protein [Monosiga brevicollis MX1]|eukprot:XP_001745479.1 hypothetical protein [Monosiga brevicollis MX1]